MKILLLIAILVASFTTAHAQKKTETLTNAQIISLVKAGMEDDLVISKIDKSKCNFDLSTDGLIALKKGGVQQAVIKVMMNKADGIPIKKEDTPAPAPVTAVAAKNTLPTLETLNMIYSFDKATNAVHALERTSARMKTRSKFLGYGGTNMVFEITPEHSGVRFMSDSLKSFIVHATSGTDGFVLYKLLVKGSSRQAVAMKFGIGKVKGAEGVISVDMRELGSNLYELLPAEKLTKGEYFFSAKSAGTAATTNVDVYAFAID